MSTRDGGLLKTGGRDLNNTGLDMKSIGGESRGGPVSFKDPPRLGNSLSIAKDAPTAAKLRKLNTGAIS